MGLGFSAPDTTLQNKEIVDNILNQMFSKVDYVDLYSLADPNKCKDYVIVGAKSLEDIFFKMNLYPAKAKDGSLYFQKTTKLQGRLPTDVHAAQQQHCKELAFFFVRIFQIFGALFLSLYDSEFPKADPEETVVAGIRTQKGGPFLAKNVFGANLGKPQQTSQSAFSWLGFGGDLGGQYTLQGSGVVQPYIRILNKYLVPPRQGSAYYRLGDKVYVMNIRGRAIPDDYTMRVEYRFERGGEGGNREYRMTATMILEPRGNGQYEVLMNNFGWVGANPQILSNRTDAHRPIQMNMDGTTEPRFDLLVNQMFSEVVRDTIRPADLSTAKYLRAWGYLPRPFSDTQLIRTSHVYFKGDQENEATAKIVWRTNVRIRDSGRTVNTDIAAKLTIEGKRSNSFMVTINFFDTYIVPREVRDEIDLPNEPVSMNFTILGNAISERDVPKSQTSGYTIPEFIEETFKNLVRDISAEKREGDRPAYNKQLELYRPYNSPSIPTGFKVQGLWKAMVQNPPIKAHCVARASQLLSSKALYGNFADKTFSSVCRLKFAYQKDGSLPEPNRPITTSKGIAALATLFIDTLHEGSPKLTADRPKWDAFRQQMRRLFEFSDDSVEATEFPDIKQETPQICSDPAVKDTDTTITLKEKTARKLYNIAQNLMSQQRQHATAAMGLIFQLFDQNELEKNRKVIFNQQLYTEGMPRVQEIANSAITLLTAYYRDCETTYQEGVRMVYNSELRREPTPT